VITRRDGVLLVATDLDGCLLDELTYAFDAARPALEKLALQRIPLVLATSKTRAEVLRLCADLPHVSAAIVESGGALLLPEGPGDETSMMLRPDGSSSTIVLGEERAVLVRGLRQIARETGAAIRPFSALDRQEVARLTGLDLAGAGLALQREYDEPFLLDDESQAGNVSAAAERLGLRATKGGRLWHLGGASDKGRALAALLRLYAAQRRSYTVLALGDSPNDLSLLRAADRAIVVPRPHGGLDPVLAAALPRAERAPQPGPEGWNAAVLAVLAGDRLPEVGEPR
jgi:mannosyl-3-phosphoglycerate phosphatase